MALDLIHGDGTVTLALVSSRAAADSFVSINTYRFPEGLAEFERICEWYGADRKLRAKLPEGVKFEKSILSVVAAPEDWDHEGYPQSNRKFVHIYRGSRQAVLIRWIAHSGTILDNSLFKPLVDNLRIVPGQWITDPPVLQARVGSMPKASDSELADDARTEVNEAAARARKSLNLGRIRKPEKLAEAIRDAIDELRLRKAVEADEKKQLAIDYGALWARLSVPPLAGRGAVSSCRHLGNLHLPSAARRGRMQSLHFGSCSCSCRTGRQIIIRCCSLT